MAEKLEQRAVVKFCFLLGKTAGETVVMLETAYKEAALGKTQVYEWFYRFRNGELQEFHDCFEKWKTRLDRFIASNGQYCEGD